jgi:hypothetical protein
MLLLSACMQREHCCFWTVTGRRGCHPLGSAQCREGAARLATLLCCNATALSVLQYLNIARVHVQIKAVVVENTFTSIEEVAPRLFPLLGLFIGPRRCNYTHQGVGSSETQQAVLQGTSAEVPVQLAGGSTSWCAISGRAGATSSISCGSQCCCCPPSRSALLHCLHSRCLHGQTIARMLADVRLPSEASTGIGVECPSWVNLCRMRCCRRNTCCSCTMS